MHEKARKEMMEEELNKMEEMTALEYLEKLNNEKKEKLMGLCLDKNIFEKMNFEIKDRPLGGLD